jgi:hypothetical protein
VSDSTPGRDALQEALENVTAQLRAVRTSLGDVCAELATVKVTVRRGKFAVVTIAASVALDLALSAGFIATQVSVHTENVSQCQQANTARAADKLVWSTFLGDLVPPGTRATKANAKALREVAHVRYLIDVKDAQRDCSRIYHLLP